MRPLQRILAIMPATGVARPALQPTDADVLARFLSRAARRHWRLKRFVLLLGAWMLGGASRAVAGDLYVVAVGIEKYAKLAGLDAVGSAEADSSDFEQYVQARWKVNAHVTLLNGPSATKYGVENAVYNALAKAHKDDSVYLFVSARGVTEPHTHAGYILTVEAQRDNGPGDGIPLTYLSALFRGRQQPSGPVYLFADLCRQPAESPVNWIQRSLEDLAGQNDSVHGVLATTPDHRSSDRVFTKALLPAMPALESDYDAFFLEVKRRASPQDPDKLPLRPARHITLSRPAFRRYPGELALLGSPIPLLFAMQAAAASSARLRDQFREAIANGKLTGPGEAFDLLQSLKTQETSAEAGEDASSLLTALEDNAQRVIADYGSGEQFPNDPMKLDAAQFLRAADYFERASSLERPARKDEIDARALFCRGRAKIFDGNGQDIDSAASDLAAAAQRYPAFPEPYNGLGIVHLARAKAAGPGRRQQVSFELGEAVRQFSQATAAAPMWAYAHHNLALTYTEMGDFRRAADEYTKAIRQTPFHPYLQYNLALLLQNQNRLRAAELQYKSAKDAFLKLIEKHTAAQTGYARAASAGGAHSRYNQEQSGLESRLITALKQNLAETYNALGTVREERKDSRGAEQYYKQALNLADLNQARYNLASLYAARGDNQAAEDAWRANLVKDPADRPSLLALARMIRATGRPAEAILYYERVLGIDAQQIAAGEELALALSEAGRPDDAARELEEAIRQQQAARGPSGMADARLYMELGDIRRSRQREADACVQYRAAARARRAGLGSPRDLKARLRRCPA